MSLRIVRADDVPTAPWRNGGGVTRELCAWPAASEWIVRASVAEIATDGPFSAFPGVDRWFAVLDGEGVDLAHDGAEPVRLAAGDAIHRFRGETATYCRLVGGSTRDFNLMVRRDAASASVAPLPALGATPGDWSACFAVAPVRVRLAGETAWYELPARALAWTTAPERLEVGPGSAPGWRIDVTLSGALP